MFPSMHEMQVLTLSHRPCYLHGCTKYVYTGSISCLKIISVACLRFLTENVGTRAGLNTHSVSLPLLSRIVLQPAVLPASTSFKMSPIIQDRVRSILKFFAAL